MDNVQAIAEMAPAIKYQSKPKRYYFDVALGSILLSGEDTGGAYCLLDLSVAPGKGVPRHTHTREDEALFVLSGELESHRRRRTIHTEGWRHSHSSAQYPTPVA